MLLDMYLATRNMLQDVFDGIIHHCAIRIVLGLVIGVMMTQHHKVARVGSLITYVTYTKHILRLHIPDHTAR